MKKFLAVLAVLAIACVSVTGALAVIPHAHGSDFDHSQHKTCPVHQVGLSGVQAAFVQALIFFFTLAACSLVFISKAFNEHFFSSTLFLRGPPALSAQFL